MAAAPWPHVVVVLPVKSTSFGLRYSLPFVTNASPHVSSVSARIFDTKTAVLSFAAGLCALTCGTGAACSIKPNKVSIDFQTVAIPPRPANSNPVAQIARTPPRDSGSSGSSWSSLLNFQNLLKVLMGAGILSVIYVLFKKFWKVSPARQQQRPAIVGFEHGEGEGPGFEPVAFQPTSPAASGITATSNVSVPPAAAAGDAAAPAVAPLEGTTTAAVLGEDLLAKVKNLPEV